MPRVNEQERLSQSFVDLSDDFEELLYLFSSSLSQLKQFQKDISSKKKHILPDTYNIILAESDSYIARFEQYKKEIERLIKTTKKAKSSIHLLTQLTKEKQKYYDLWRSQQTLIGSLITSTDWQSPTFLYSLHSLAGRQTGKILSTINDYKRDQHYDQKEFQQDFLKEYVDAPVKFPIASYLTHSGMAAFTTILNFLIMEKKVTGPVLIGKSIYFENKELVKKAFDDILEVDEAKTQQILKTTKIYQPSIIIFDSLCNSSDVAAPNLPIIIDFLIHTVKTHTYIVIDNTGLATAFQPMSYLFAKSLKVHTIVFESLNKYYQFGADRITGGIIYGMGKDIQKLFDYRVHLGTNISDSASHTLPKPDRKMLDKRLKRLGRNAALLAIYLQDYITNHPNNQFDKIIYPGLSNHPSYQWMKYLPFHGGFFAISFKKKYKKVRIYKRFVNAVINTAKRKKINIVSGTSFGMNTTRIYLTALRADFGEPFIRVSLGTETLMELEIIKDIFIEVMEKF